MILALAAFKSFIAEESLKVDDNFIVELSSSVINRNDTSVLLSDNVDLIIDISVCDLLYFLGSLDSLIVSNLNLRLCNAYSL